MTSAEYERAAKEIEAAVKRVFPKAKPAEGWGGPAWKARRPEGAVAAPETGTYDPDHTIVGLVERKQGPTLYFLDPGDYFVLDKHRAPLEAAGLKVMRGCLVWARKGPFPVEPVEALMRAVRERDEGTKAPAAKRASKKGGAKKGAAKKAAKKAPAKAGTRGRAKG